MAIARNFPPRPGIERDSSTAMTRPNYWDEATAAHYDEGTPPAPAAMLDRLAELAGNRPVLEFAVGTGRVALPLSGRGLTVHGIEYSPAMTEQLRRKPGGDRIQVTIGDMAETRVEGEFGLVYLIFNTIMNLTTQDDQVRCFENAAAHLISGGHFVVEVIVPKIRALPRGSTAHVFAMDSDHIGIEEFTDVPNQIAYSHHWFRHDDRLRTHSAPYRYVWPSELDLMARLAGLRLVERWADWERSPFTGESESHVSAWRKP
jgi:SAM-dependent methyltransferase